MVAASLLERDTPEVPFACPPERRDASSRPRRMPEYRRPGHRQNVAPKCRIVAGQRARGQSAGACGKNRGNGSPGIPQGIGHVPGLPAAFGPEIAALRIEVEIVATQQTHEFCEYPGLDTVSRSRQEGTTS